MSKPLHFPKVLLVAYFFSTSYLLAETRVVDSISDDPNTIGTLPYWILNGSEGDIIDCSAISGQPITLTKSLPAITKSYIINGAGITIDGASSYQAFQVASGTVSINNVNVQNAISRGGDGGDGYSGGGGAVGGGGALYVHGGTTVTLTTSSLINNKAQGGNGGAADNTGNGGGGGGGGFGGGQGGDALIVVSTGGGGGGHSNGGDGGNGASAAAINGGDGVYYGGGGGGAGINSVFPGGAGGKASPDGTFLGGSESSGNGGGGAGDSQNGVSATGSGGTGVPGNGGQGIGADSSYGSGGGGGSSAETGFGGGAGFGAAGGGGGYNSSGGSGGVLGGGGAGGIGGSGGNGGFGAGGGGALTGGTGGAGYGAGGGNGGSDSSGIAGGGGGSGLGGAIFVQSGGNLIIVDAPQIAGNTSIAGTKGSSTNSSDPGYIEPEDGLALGRDIFLRELGSITFDLSNTLTIATAIEGDQTSGPDIAGGLFKKGTGTLNLNGANTYSGITSVEQGTLNLNGSVIGSAIVGSQGKLIGNATISGNLTSLGILAPGNGIGTISTTNLILGSSSRLDMEVAPNGSNDLIAASQTASISGTLNVIPLAGNYHNKQSYTIITAATGRVGTFSNLTSSEPSLLKVTYGTNNVIIEVLPISTLNLPLSESGAAACYFGEGVVPGSDVETVTNVLLNLSNKQIADGLIQLQPSLMPGVSWSQIQNALLVRSSYSKHLKDINLPTNSYNCSYLWGEAIGSLQTQNKTKNHFGYKDRTVGGTLGVDALYCHNFTLGTAASYTFSHINWSHSIGDANLNSYYGGFYANWSNGKGFVNASFLGAYSHYKLDRNIHFGSINRQAKSSFNSWESLLGVELGFNFQYNECFMCIPFINLDFIYLSEQGFKEKGANSLNLKVKEKHNEVVQSEFGVILTNSYSFLDSWVPGSLEPRIKLSYIIDSALTSEYLHANFVHSSCDFTAYGLLFPRNLGAISLGFTYFNCDNTLGATLFYDAQFGKDYYTQAANIGFDVKF